MRAVYYKQFEAVAVHNQRTDMEKTVMLIVHLKGVAQQILAALPQSDTIEYATLVNCLKQRFGQTPYPSEEAGTQKPHIEVWKGSQNYAVDI